MKKLSEAGKLYLQDYYILEEARTDLEDYLDDVIDETKKILDELLDGFNNPNYKQGLWSNKSTKGAMELEIQPEGIGDLFVKSKITIKYKDIRHATDLKNPATIKLYIWSPAIANRFKNEVERVSNKLFKNNIYDKTYMELDIENSSESADKISTYMIDKYNAIMEILEEWMKNNE